MAATCRAPFYRKDASLPPEQRYYDGTPPETMRFGAAWPDANFQLVDRTTEIAPGIHLISLVSDKPGHAGAARAVARHRHARRTGHRGGLLAPRHRQDRRGASKINPRISLIAGGLPSVVAKDDEIDKIATTLRDTYKVGYVAPGHCTGEPTFACAAQGLRRALPLRRSRDRDHARREAARGCRQRLTRARRYGRGRSEKLSDAARGERRRRAQAPRTCALTP
jgi:hypothetical protein